MAARPVEEPALILRCACCGMPFARVEGDLLLIESRHKGHWHVNTVSIQALVSIVQAKQDTDT